MQPSALIQQGIALFRREDVRRECASLLQPILQCLLRELSPYLYWVVGLHVIILLLLVVLIVLVVQLRHVVRSAL